MSIGIRAMPPNTSTHVTLKTSVPALKKSSVPYTYVPPPHNVLRTHRCLQNAHAITYASGLSAAYAALVYLSPKRIAISRGYHGVFGSISVYARARGAPVPLIGLEDDFQEGDLAWVETPLNPTGEARDMTFYADKVG